MKSDNKNTANLSANKSKLQESNPSEYESKSILIKDTVNESVKDKADEVEVSSEDEKVDVMTASNMKHVDSSVRSEAPKQNNKVLADTPKFDSSHQPKPKKRIDEVPENKEQSSKTTVFTL